MVKLFSIVILGKESWSSLAQKCKSWIGCWLRICFGCAKYWKIDCVFDISKVAENTINDDVNVYIESDAVAEIANANAVLSE